MMRILQRLNKIWNDFWALSFEKKIEFCLSLAIVYFAYVQWRTAVKNNEGTSQQNDQLIAASKYNAYAADRNAQAASNFAQSAHGINQGVQDAAGRLQAQARGTQAIAEASTAQANASRAIADQASAQATATSEIAKTAQQQLSSSERPWLKVSVELVPSPEHASGAWVDDVGILNFTYRVMAQNTGRTPAVEVYEGSYVVPMVQVTQVAQTQAKYCIAPTKPFDKVLEGEGATVYPGEPEEIHETHAMLYSGDLKKELAHPSNERYLNPSGMLIDLAPNGIGAGFTEQMKLKMKLTPFPSLSVMGCLRYTVDYSKEIKYAKLLYEIEGLDLRRLPAGDIPKGQIRLYKTVSYGNSAN